MDFSDYDENEINSFYDTLSEAVRSVPYHNCLKVIRDFNAKVGQDRLKFVFNAKTNSNGEKLLDFCEENSLKESSKRSFSEDTREALDLA